MVPRASSPVTRVSCLPLFATKERKRKLNKWYKQLFGLTRANKDKILQDNMNAENWLVEGKNAIVHFKVKALNSYYWTLTTSKKNKGWSKLGFFCVFLMTVEWTTCPPHSNSILGDATLASWYLFMLRTPQHNTCGRKPHPKTSRLKEEDRWTKIQEGKDRGWASGFSIRNIYFFTILSCTKTSNYCMTSWPL